MKIDTIVDGRWQSSSLALEGSAHAVRLGDVSPDGQLAILYSEGLGSVAMAAEASASLDGHYASMQEYYETGV